MAHLHSKHTVKILILHSTQEPALILALVQARERRRELQRMRALMSYHEEKCRRAKKIKSKRYRCRGKRKMKERRRK